MKSQRYIFVGDRFSTLNRMISHGLNITHVFCAKDFYHGEALADPSITLTQIEDKASLVEALKQLDYDILISNGCPYILPVSELKASDEQLFINIHGSALPNFPGPHPVNAAMLNQQDGGATCHHMLDAVDSGEIISQITVPYTDDLDLGLLYMLTLLAEVDAFELALQRGFKTDPQYTNDLNEESYFKRSDENMEINFSNSAKNIAKQVRAFGISSQGASFKHKGHEFKTFGAEICVNSYLVSKSGNYQENEVVFIYDGVLVICKGESFLKLKNVQTNSGAIAIGDVL